MIIAVCNCSNQVGGWSTKGLVLDESQSDETSVTCLTQHLTSFAVLVKISDTDETQVRAKAIICKNCMLLLYFSHLHHQMMTKHYQ